MYPSSFLVFLPRSAFGLFRVCILPFIACLPLWAGEMRVRRSKTSRVEMKVDYLSLCYRGSDNPAFIWFCDFLSKASRLSCDYSPRKKDQKKNKGRASKRRGRGMTSLKIVRPAFRGRACAPHLGAHAEYNAVRHWRKVVTPDPFQLLNF